MLVATPSRMIVSSARVTSEQRVVRDVLAPSMTYPPLMGATIVPPTLVPPRRSGSLPQLPKSLPSPMTSA
jgi:hypothetical protein